MKLLLSIGLALSFVVTSSAQHRTHRTNAPSVRMPRLRQELLKRVSEDQRIRNELIKEGIDHPDQALLDQMNKIDAINTARIKVIIKQYGWPGPKLIGRDGTDAFFLLAQHADPAFQKKVLPLVQKAYRRGISTGQNYALFTDRALVESGKPQIYGTAARPFDQWKGGEPVFEPIEDEANVDKRRADVGLMPLAEYREFMKRLYFPEQKPKPFPVGDYQYTGYDKDGKKAVEGQLSITSVESRRIGSKEQPLLKGHWQLSKVGNQETVGPQVGSGELQGSIMNGEININLNPNIFDNNVILRGIIEDRRFHGTWSFSGFAGKLSEGTFEATRK